MTRGDSPWWREIFWWSLFTRINHPNHTEILSTVRSNIFWFISDWCPFRLVDFKQCWICCCFFLEDWVCANPEAKESITSIMLYLENAYYVFNGQCLRFQPTGVSQDICQSKARTESVLQCIVSFVHVWWFKVEMWTPLSSFEVWALDVPLLPFQFLFTFCHVSPLTWEDLFHAAAQVTSFADHLTSRICYDNLAACLHYIVHFILKFFLEYI